MPPTTGFWPQKPLQVYPLQVAFVLGLGMPAPCEVDQTLKDGDHVGPLTVLHVPGHTPGSMAFYWPENERWWSATLLSPGPSSRSDGHRSRSTTNRIENPSESSVI